jgi:hypothetical protein
MAYTDIDKSDDYFNTKLYTGNGTTDRAITGVGYQPDFVWIKNRTTNFGSRLLDSVRGATKELFSNVTNTETTNTEGLKSFDSDGFTLGNHGGTNENSSNFVSWNWLAGGTASSNTDGSITSTVSASTTSGFSIVSYTGTGANATVGHGLGSALDFIIVKKRNGAVSWCTTGTANGWDQCLFLDTTDQSGSYTFWQSTAPTSSVFSIDGSSAVNGSGDTFIAYCFAEKKGFSKFGSYTGNGSTDGTFVYTGFSPAFIIVKRTDSTESWGIIDNKRQIYNPNNTRLFANLNVADDTSESGIDLLSQGFKIRNSWIGNNASGGSYIYMCFAENPFVTSGGIPTTAR